MRPRLSQFRQVPGWIHQRDHVRQRALFSFVRTTLVLSPVSIVIALVLAIETARQAGGIRSFLPFVLLIVLHGYGIRRSILYRRNPAPPVKQLGRSYDYAILICALIGLLWGMSALFAAAPPARPLQGFLVPTLIYGGVLMAPVRSGALLYIAFVTLGEIGSVPMHGTAGHGFQLLAAIYGITGGMVVAWQHTEFARSACNELKLEEQAEIIGILLHDFEEQGSDWLWETDARMQLRTPSERLLATIGCEAEAASGLNLRRWIGVRLGRPSETQEGLATLADCLDARLAFRKVRISFGQGDQERWLLLTGKPVVNADGSFRGYRGVGSDITHARRSEQQIAWLAGHDGLTGLPNRASFHDALRQTFARQMAAGRPLAVLCLDLDGFKAVNDSLGHLAGDALLAQVAGRLRACMRDRDVVGRLGGDEFALLLPGADRAVATMLAERLMQRIGEPFEIDGMAVAVGASIGIMLVPEELPPDRPLAAQDLLRGADLAMYSAKQEGRGTIRFFEPALRDDVQDRRLLQADLRHAAARGELVLQFQPIMHATTGRVVAAEALLRWRHPERGLMPPADFIAMAEESGLIVGIGAWAMQRACREATGWADTIGVSVNLSPVQLRDPALCGTVEAVLRETGLAPNRLEFEITESMFVENSAVVRENLLQLKQKGIRIALDDFGTGFSSLSYLRKFPVDIVKIDRSFVRDLGRDIEADMIVQAIAGMATGLGITITAEGVETVEQAARLRATGCDQLQGFLYSRPCDPADLQRFIALQDRPGPTGAAGGAAPSVAPSHALIS